MELAGFTADDKAIVVFGSELQPKMQGRTIASCIRDEVCQPLVMVLTNNMRRCGWILLSFTLKKSNELSLKADSIPRAFNLFEIRGFHPLGTLLMRKLYTFSVSQFP